MPRLLDEHGRELRLGEKLGEGGEGAVYRLSSATEIAIKVYKAPLTHERVAKIRALSSLGQSEVKKFTAWPIGLVLDQSGNPRGLILPVVDRAKDIHHLYSPRSRRDHFPEANWRFLVHTAMNLARAFGAIHHLGLVIGDVNHGSVLVAQDGTVRLIDVDSFQVPLPGRTPLLCTVAVPLFQPPELYGADLSKQVRTPNHDAFGLAVLIFQLLLQGRHPFAGRYLGPGDMPIERAIPEHRFAFSRNAASYQMERPPNALGLGILTPDVAELFESAFAPDAATRKRPSAAVWAAALDGLKTSLARCPRNASHEYVKTLQSCPWCLFEGRTSVFLFGVPSAPAAASAESEYTALIAQIRAIKRPSPVHARQVTTPVAPAAAAAEVAKREMSSTLALVAGILTILGGFVAMAGSSGAGWLLIIVGGTAIATGTRAERARRQPWIHAFKQARTEQAAATEALRVANTFPGVTRAQQSVKAAMAEWDSLPGLRTRKFQELERNKRNEQMRQHLDRHLIENASISGIGPSRIATLSAFGIDTAADIDARRVSQVPQFGEVLTGRLVAWRHSVERRFVFDASKPLPKEAVARVEKEIADQRRKCLEALRQSGRALRDASLAEAQAAERAAQRVAVATARFRQAEVDVRAALNGNLPA